MAVIESSIAAMKFILVTGSSSSDKAVIGSSLGVLLKRMGHRVTAVNIDCCLNRESSWSSTNEIYITADGCETPASLGVFERFLNISLTGEHHLTTGKVFQRVIEQSCGSCASQVIIEWMQRVSRIPVDGSTESSEVCIVQLDGVEQTSDSNPFLAAFEQFSRPALKDNFMHIQVNMLHRTATGKLKTKPIQHSVRQFLAAGLAPDLLICRSADGFDDRLRQKIADFSLLEVEHIVGVHDLSNIYQVPQLLNDKGVYRMMRQRLCILPFTRDIFADMTFSLVQSFQLGEWMDSYKEVVTIALIGKNAKTVEAYQSLNEALVHAAFHINRKVEIKYVEPELLQMPKTGQEDRHEEAWNAIKEALGIVLCGRSDSDGVEGMITCCKYARENMVPFVGIGLGMHCATVEYARNVLGIEGAHSAEFREDLAQHQQIIVKAERCVGRKTTVFISAKGLLSTLHRRWRTRVLPSGGRDRVLAAGKREMVAERHHHSYTVNPQVVPELLNSGLRFVGVGWDKENVELQKVISKNKDEAAAENDGIGMQEFRSFCFSRSPSMPEMQAFELDEELHQFFIGTQFQPEYSSSVARPSAILVGLLCAATGQLQDYLEQPQVGLGPRMGRIRQPLEFPGGVASSFSEEPRF